MTADTKKARYDRLFYFLQGTDLAYPFHIEKREITKFPLSLFDERLKDQRRMILHRDPHYRDEAGYFFRVFAKIEEGKY